MSIFETFGAWARRIKRESVMLWFAYRIPATLLLVKALCVFVAAYALSSIDLIPDFIPVRGYVHDALLISAFIWLSVQVLPMAVIHDSRARAEVWMAQQGKKPTSCMIAVPIVALLLSVGYATWIWFKG